MRMIHPQNSGETYYDIEYDWDLIESSFLKQYGIRLRTEDDMSWSEFCSLLSGIMPDTPLGQIVQIRAEKDRKVINKFTKDQKRIYNDWKKFRNSQLRELGQSNIIDWVAIQEWAKQFQ